VDDAGIAATTAGKAGTGWDEVAATLAAGSSIKVVARRAAITGKLVATLRDFSQLVFGMTGLLQTGLVSICLLTPESNSIRWLDV
jgi:hypothetical protein